MKPFDQTAARRIAQQQLTSIGYALRQGVVLVNADGWRFPVRLSDQPDDKPYDSQPMALTLLVP